MISRDIRGLNDVSGSAKRSKRRFKGIPESFRFSLLSYEGNPPNRLGVPGSMKFGTVFHDKN